MSSRVESRACPGHDGSHQESTVEAFLGGVDQLTAAGRREHLILGDGNIGTIGTVFVASEEWRHHLLPADCDDGGTVTVDELVTCVAIAMGQAQSEICWPCDNNADGQVTVDELIQAVNAALRIAPAEPAGQLVSHGTCKPDTMFAMRQRSSDQDCLEWQYSDGTLSLTHVNAGFNCCPTELLGDVTVNGDAIRIKEEERLENPCHCLCLYDLEYTFNNLGPGDYAISVEEPYVDAGDPSLSTTATLRDGTSDSFCVTRTKYPWGVY